MRVLDISYDDPARNLALDEALLNAVEAGEMENTLRFWESPVPFVVLGVSQSVRDHVWQENCRVDGVPIMRRCSAGGCVLQGPGSLNFAVAVRYDLHADLASIRGSYNFLLSKVAEAIRSSGSPLTPRGISDLAEADRKVSGNAQKRRKHAMLHHGTLLYSFDPGKMTRYLKEPADRPDYRGDRPHETFITAIAMIPSEIRSAVATAFAPAVPRETELAPELERVVDNLAIEKYVSEEWIYRRR